LYIDFHIHPLKNFPFERLLREIEEAEMDYCVLLPMDIDAKDLKLPHVRKKLKERIELLISFYPNLYISMEVLEREAEDKFPHFRIENEYVSELARRDRRLIPAASIDIAKGRRYLKRKLREIEKLGMKIVKVYPTLQFFNPLERTFFEFLRECEKRRYVVVYHTGCDPSYFETIILSEDANPAHLSQALENYNPRIPILLAHSGAYSLRCPGIWFEEAIRVARKFDNVYLESSAVNWIFTLEKYVRKLREVGMERVIFGSDYPVVLNSSIREERETVERSSLLSPKEKEMVLGENAAELLKSYKVI